MQKKIHESLLFQGLDKEFVDKFLKDSRSVFMKKGEYLWRENEVSDNMFLLESGLLEVLLGIPNEMVVSKIESGAVIGELCIFGQKKRSASVRAAEDVKLLLINSEQFQQHIVAQDLGYLLISCNIAKMLSERLVYANEFIQKLQQMAEKPAVKSEIERYRQRFSSDSLFN